MAKNFSNITNPANMFISGSEAEPAKKKESIPEGFKVNPEYIEKKSRRVNLLLQPSTVDKVKELSAATGVSMNEIFSEAIKEYLEKEGI